VFDDDNQVVRLVVERGVYTKGGACLVFVNERTNHGEQ